MEDEKIVTPEVTKEVKVDEVVPETLPVEETSVVEDTGIKNPVVIDGAVVSDPTKVGVNSADMQN